MPQKTLFPHQKFSLDHFERLARREGFRSVAGVDEAGRGPLAGPVVAAAVVLPAGFELEGLTDSKQVAFRTRLRLFEEIRTRAEAVGVGIIPAADIDRINILQATLLAMTLAVDRLAVRPDFLLVDGISSIPIPIRQSTLKKGDARSLSIAAASIVAKVVRDRMMIGYDRRFPGYGFAGHKGYGSADHRAAIERLGPCPLHRRTFRGVREFCGEP